MTPVWVADDTHGEMSALLDRDGFIAQIDRLLGEAAAGQGRLLFLGGEAGIGKTALVRHVCDGARHRARVLSGACDSLSTPRPLGRCMTSPRDWASLSGSNLLRFLGRRLGATSVLLIATDRDDELDSGHPLRVVMGDLAPAPAAPGFLPQDGQPAGPR